MDSTVEQTIRDAVSKLVKSGYMFTAFDITKLVRVDLGKGTPVSHKDVNGVVQEMFNNASMDTYVRDIVSVGASVSPWLYYHPYSDVADYDPQWITNDPKQDDMKADVTATTSSSGGFTPPTLDIDDDDEEDDDAVTYGVPAIPAPANIPVSSVTTRLGKNEHRLTKEGRLQIPIHMARKAGFTPHQTVMVVEEGSKLTLASAPIAATNTTFVQVEKDGRIRLSSRMLKALAANPKSEVFKVERDNGGIVIETV